MEREREVRKNTLQTVQMEGNKNKLGCACTTSDTELRTELEMYPHKSNID